jgi:D-3-phosphoglycerate dehydrogenase
VSASYSGTSELSDPAMLEPLDDAGLAWTLEEIVGHPGLGSASLGPAELARHDAWIIGNERVTAAALDAAPAVPLLIARFGVGTDTIDLAACTRRDVIVAITPDAMARPVAVAALAHLLAATLHLPAKHAMVRDGRWNEGRRRWLGRGLDGRTVGLVGLGNIGSVLAELLAPLRVRILATDPQRTRDEAARLGAELVELPDLLARSDAVVVLCPLTPATHHLIGAAELAAMRPTAVLVNVSRGPVVDQAALVDSLERGVIAGAGLDVFETEPLPAGDRLAGLPNVSLSPHGLAQTDQLLETAAASAIAAVVEVSRGRAPRYVANPDVLARPTLAARLSAARSVRSRSGPRPRSRPAG